MAFYLYILKSSDGSYYTGHTEDLDVRVAAHNAGTIPGYTRSRRPVEVVFADTFPSRIDALERERQVKGWTRRKKEALMRSDWDRLRELAKPGAK